MIFSPTLSPLSGAIVLTPGVQLFGSPDTTIGDKAQMLVDHYAAIQASGFASPPRVIFGEDRLDLIFRYNGLGESLRKTCSINQWHYFQAPPEIMTEVRHISAAIRKAWGNVPVVVRSSAMGDARGTGVYKSWALPNDPEKIFREMGRVLGSYFSDSARLWRHRAEAGEGFAIILEPLVSQEIPSSKKSVRRMAPLISGMGYSSSGISPGFIKLGWGMSGGGADRLTRAGLEVFGYEARRLFGEDSENSMGVHSVPYAKREEDRYPIDGVSQKAFAELIEGVRLNPIFNEMDSLEVALGAPVYIEWAIHAPKGRQGTYLTQLAAIPRDEEKWEFGTSDSVLLQFNDVRRGRELEIGAIVFVEGRDQLHGLRQFNLENSGFLLIYGDEVFGHGPYRGDCPLQMEHMSNAAAMMLSPTAETWVDWEEHLRGLAETAEIMIGRGDNNGIREFHQSIRRHFHWEHGLDVYRRSMRIRYSSSREVAGVTPA